MATYDLLQVSPRRFYVHNVETKARFSHKPLGRKVALRQLHAIRSASPEEVGEGLMSWVTGKVKAVAGRVRDVVSGPRLDYSPKIKEWLARNGHHVITSLTVTRAPVVGAISGALDALSWGKFSAALKKQGYDGVFHLGLVGTFEENGHEKKFIMEKNETVNIGGNVTFKDSAQHMAVPMAEWRPTINAFLSGCLKHYGPKEFFLYEAFSSNCQRFVFDLLSCHGCMTPELDAFIMQDASELAKGLSGTTRGVARGLTDFAALADRAIHGGGLEHVVHHVLTELAKKPRRKVRKSS